jgi:ubiquinone/menaquinone biosynthesis C-methylase UbiE
MILRSFMRLFFHLLYHSMAWTYDIVAGMVSAGRWKNWVRSILPLMDGKQVLELGIGPGTLQTALLEAGISAVGLDESRQMLRIAKNGIERQFPDRLKILRCRAEHLPFPVGAFDTVTATFPSEYIFRPETLSECKRVLRPGGKFILLIGVEFGGRSLRSIFLRGLYRFTGQGVPDSRLLTQIEERINQFGFVTTHTVLPFHADHLTILLASS